MKILVILAALSVTPVEWAGECSPSRTISEADGGQTITCRLGEIITVRIRNPAAGGYDIVSEHFDPKILCLQARKEASPESTPVPRYGDFGKIVFELLAVGTGETDVVIRIARKWEIKEDPEEYFRVRIRIMD